MALIEMFLVLLLVPGQAVNPDDSTAEASAEWHYWVAQGYCF